MMSLEVLDVPQPFASFRARRGRAWWHLAAEIIVAFTVSLALVFAGATLLGMWARVAWEGVLIGWRVLP
jgi:hypothetical protein